jgi:hypothetical protein
MGKLLGGLGSKAVARELSKDLANVATWLESPPDQRP